MHSGRRTLQATFPYSNVGDYVWYTLLYMPLKMVWRFKKCNSELVAKLVIRNYPQTTSKLPSLVLFDNNILKCFKLENV